ncbi:MAG: branched-chain amino acid ABC transporter permease [Spirochaetales bacterium]|nr:branched-chain amino acid ABC transporter permease [Spirochaetales bacterium]
MEVLAAQIVNGLSLGSVYVLLVTAFNLLLLVAMIIHYSFPVIVVFSMYISWFVMNLSGSIWLGIFSAVLSAVILNVITAPIFQHIMKKRGEVDINATMVASMGMGMIITDILSHVFNQGFPIAFPDKLTGNDKAPLIKAGLITVSQGQIIILLSSVIFVIILFWLLFKTRTGRAFRAIAEDPHEAKLVGIPLMKTGFKSYAITGLLGGVTSVLMAVLLGSASAGLGDNLGHKVLAVSIIAGLGNLTGGLVVGLLLGIFEAIIQGYFAGSWSNTVSFLVMLVIVLAKPKGLFGSNI